MKDRYYHKFGGYNISNEVTKLTLSPPSVCPTKWSNTLKQFVGRFQQIV